MTECSAYKYRVFLSYSKRDRAWGKWLQAALANNSIDKDLVGRRTPAGTVPKTLGPIYSDRAIPGDGPLSERTLAALRASEYLVVLCSPDAAKSRRINEQIRCFTALGRADRVIPVVVEGEPGDPARECFAAALRFRLRQDRLLIDRRGEPVAAAVRLDRDGKERVRHKLAASLLYIGLADIERRARRARKRRIRLGWARLVAAVLALILTWQAGSAWARYQLSHDPTLLDRTLERGALMASTAVAASTHLGLPRGLSARMLQDAEEWLRAIADLGRDTPPLRLRKLSMLIEFVGMYGALGEAELLRARASETEQLLQRIAADAAENPVRQRALAASYDRLGDALRTYGMVHEALASYRAGVACAERIASDPGQMSWRHDLAVRWIKIGNGELEQGALDAALASYRRSRTLGEYLTRVNSGNPRWQHDLLVAHEKIGDVARLRDDVEAAIASYHESGALAARLVAGDPANPEWQRALALSHVRIGDVLRMQNKSDEALASYRAAHAIAARMAAADPGNSDRQEQLGLAQQRLGLALEARGDVEAALTLSRASLAVARRLAAIDPGNASWQRNLAIAHRQVGDLLRSGNGVDQVFEHYQANEAIIGRLAAVAPGDGELQYDLATAHARLGLVYEARGRLESAREQYEASVAIGSRLVAAEWSHSGRRRDLALTHARLAGVLHPLGKSGQALAELRQGRKILAALLKSSPALEPWKGQLAQFDDRIAALEGRAPLLVGKAAADKTPPTNDAASGPALSRTSGMPDFRH